SSSDFPTTQGAFDTSYNGGSEGFVTGVRTTTPDIRQPISPISFGNVNVGSTSYMATTIYNDGDATLTVNSITRTSGSTDFTYVEPSTPFGIIAGSLADPIIRFSPTSGGAKSAVFNVNSNDPDEPDVTFNVSGTGIVVPDIRQPIAAISWGNYNVGSYSLKTTSIYNDGTGPLTINSVSRTSGSTEFTFMGPSVPFDIGAGSFSNITLQFAPTSAGAKSAVFTVNSNDPDEPNVTFDVSGTGVVVVETISTPSTPSGTTSGFTNTSYSYSTGSSTSNFGHDVQYLFDWGDGTDSGWLAAGTTSAQKSWSSANTYAVKAKARCATHTAVESSWSSTLSVSIAAPVYDNSPSNYQVIPECLWSGATGGGTWASEVQITDITGGSVVSVYFNYGGGNRRGPFTLWTAPGANQNTKYLNILSSIDALDSETFTYYGRVGAVEFSTQDTSHKIQVVARTLNGNYSKTFPGLNLKESNTADTTRRMIVQNFVNNATYRSSCGFFNPTADSVTIEFRLMDDNGNTIGSTFSRTLVGHDFQSFSPFNQAGVSYPTYSYNNVVLWVTPTSGSGEVMAFGASANNTSNDPAAHIGVQYQGAFNNAPSNYQVIPECIWSPASGGGTWVSEVQITDITGGSNVSVYFDYGGGARRGPFTIWTSGGANHSIRFANILSTVDAADSGAFSYFGRVGAVEFSTQDASHKIQVLARTFNGDYSKTLPGMNLTDSNTANTWRRMMLQNFVNNATYRSSCGFFNPTADSVTVEFRLVDWMGDAVGSTFTRTLVGHDFQSFSPFNQAGVSYPSYSYDNVVLWITPTSGSGKVMVFGASANNTSNDPAAHIGVQYQ
ncbi:MAG: choice-of-anchor D domain-containing protein, partial [Candidatus Aminicenantes bacterium]|nr:choice-of-anchor D domain-containing protein [Candidatus Aminicenantes bacterium]